MNRTQLWRFFALDLLLLNLSLGVSYWLRFVLLDGAPAQAMDLITVSLLWTLVFALYSLKSNTHQVGELTSFLRAMVGVLKVQIVGFVGTVFLLYFLTNTPFSRLALLFSLGISTFVLLAARIIALNKIKLLIPKSLRQKSILIVGPNHKIVESQLLKLKKEFVEFNSTKNINYQEVINLLKSGSLQTSNTLIIFVQDSAQAELSQLALSELSKTLLEVVYLQPLDTTPLGGAVQLAPGYLSYSLNDYQPAVINLAIKRVIDVVASFVGILVLSPLLALIALAIKLSSPGPIFFSQNRVGLGGRIFKMWKFRSMKVSLENQPGWTTANDNRKTKIGTFIRATSIDELPQLWNVLSGDMSLVGPRPEQPYYVDEFSKTIPFYHLRHKAPVGITGWAQINGLRGDTSIAERINFDLFYIRSWSLWLDFKIIMLTFVKGFLNKNAY